MIMKIEAKRVLKIIAQNIIFLEYLSNGGIIGISGRSVYCFGGPGFCSCSELSWTGISESVYLPLEVIISLISQIIDFYIFIPVISSSCFNYGICLFIEFCLYSVNAEILKYLIWGQIIVEVDKRAINYGVDTSIKRS